MVKYLLYFGLASLAFWFAYRGEHGFVDLTYFATCGLVIATNMRHVNIVSLAAILMVVKVVEFIIYESFFNSFNAYGLYFSYIVIDLALMVFIYLRVPIIRGGMERYGLQLDDTRWFTTNADLLLALIQLLHVIVGTLMLIEHLIRNLDDIYVATFLKLFLKTESVEHMNNWLLHNFTLIYNNFVFIELTITGFEFLAILCQSGYYLREKSLINS